MFEVNNKNVVLVFLLLTLNIFHKDLRHENVKALKVIINIPYSSMNCFQYGNQYRLQSFGSILTHVMPFVCFNLFIY